MEILDPQRILTYFHCAECRRQIPANESMEKWTRVNVGFTSTGIRVWCVRHRKEVIHVTPEELQRALDSPLKCHCCPHGHHVTPSHQNN